jgi:hypothetical protein
VPLRPAEEQAVLRQQPQGGRVRGTGEPSEHASEALASRDGNLHVSPQRDGPLHVRGNLEVVSGTGRTLDRVRETWLCRCGHSSHKPFCDGSHRKAAFHADGA